MFVETGIRETVIEEIIAHAEKYQIEKVMLFGSRARGDYKERSDIDLAVRGGDTTRFALDTEDVNTLLFFDVVDLDGPIQQELLESIEAEGKVLYEKI